MTAEEQAAVDLRKQREQQNLRIAIRKLARAIKSLAADRSNGPAAQLAQEAQELLDES